MPDKARSSKVGAEVKKRIIVLPAFNASSTLRKLVEDLPYGHFHEALLVDDASSDNTREVARSLNIEVVVHEENRGYGGNQKTCYREALERNADFIVMLHPDYQYDARMIPPALAVLEAGVCDVVLGNRIRTRKEALDGGMPWLKYLANRGLSFLENILSGQNLGEWHSGFRAYRREVLETIPFHHNSDDFVFDSQFLLQAIHFGYRVGDIPMPVRYHDGASSISLLASSKYAIQTGWVFFQWFLHRSGLWQSALFLRDKENLAGDFEANRGDDPG